MKNHHVIFSGVIFKIAAPGLDDWHIGLNLKISKNVSIYHFSYSVQFKVLYITDWHNNSKVNEKKRVRPPKWEEIIPWIRGKAMETTKTDAHINDKSRE